MSKKVAATARQRVLSAQAAITTDQLRAAETREPVSKRADCARKLSKPHSLQPQALPTQSKLPIVGALQPRAPSATQAAPYESRTVTLRGAETPKDFSSLLLVAKVVEADRPVGSRLLQ